MSLSEALSLTRLERFPSFPEWQRRLNDIFGLTPIVGFGSFTGSTFEGDSQPWGRCRLRGAALTRLDTADGFTAVTSSLPKKIPDRGVLLLFRVAFGNGSALPQQTGSFQLEIDGRPALTFTKARDRQIWRGSGTTFLFIPELARAAPPGEILVLDQQLTVDTWAIEGVGLLWIRPNEVTPGKPLTLRVVADPPMPSLNWVRFGSPNESFIAFLHEADIVSLISEIERPAERRPGRPLFGDIHNHTGDGTTGIICGRGTRESAMLYARDAAGLDFCCLSEHDFQLGDGEWELLQDFNDRLNAPGSFVTIHGYEWTSASYGHRNVYFRERGGPFMRTSDRSPKPNDWMGQLGRGDHQFKPEVVWNQLNAWGGDAMTVPHHPTSAIWPLSLPAAFNPRYDRLVEIYSSWGDSLHTSSPLNVYVQYVPELEISRLIDRFPIGFIASSDSHDGHPGNAQGNEWRDHIFHPAGSGYVAVWADDFSRDGIFDALFNRNCYAVTGGRLVLSVSLNGHQMGTIVRPSELTERPSLEVSVSTILPCEKVEIFDGPRLVHVESLGAVREATVEWTDRDWAPGEKHTYYTKITRADGEQAWSSPIHVRD